MRCDSCYRSGPAAYAQFQHNVGMLFARREYSTAGDFCRDCLARSFWHHTLHNVTLGWWGYISFVMTWVFLVSNIHAYVRARRELGKVRVAAPAQPLTGLEAQQRLAPFEHNVRMRLREGEAPVLVARDLARLHAVSEEAAAQFVDSLQREAA